MTWRQSTRIGALSGVGCGALLAMPVALADPAYRMGSRTVGDVAAFVAIWAVGGALCGFISTSVIWLIDALASKLSLTKRRLLQSRRYWLTFLGLLILMACASVIPFWQSCGAYTTDGEEVVGWPRHFFARGGYCYVERCRLDGLIIDIGVWTMLAALAAASSCRYPRRQSGCP
jgi:hypothetical protein